MSKVLKIAVLAGLMATLNGRAYAAPINIDFNNGTFSNWTVSLGQAGTGIARVVNTAPSRRDVNAHNLDEVGDPADWFSPLTQPNVACGNPANGRSCYAFLEAGPIPGSASNGNTALGNLYTSIVSNVWVANSGVTSTLRLWAFFDALDQKSNQWNDDGYARVRDLTTNTLLPLQYVQSNSSVPCDQGSDASRWPHNSFPYLPANCVAPFLGAMSYTLVAGHSYQVEAGVRNGAGGTNDNSIPASLGLEADYSEVNTVPEPSTLLLLGSGIGVALASYRRRRTPKA